MKKKLGKSGKGKITAVILLGFFLFSGSMMVLFDFVPTKKVQAVPLDFIKVKDGMFYYLDNKGYNFKFQCEINQILLEESEQIISDKQITVISDNSFGRTVLTFDRLSNGKVKFTIDHDGNMIRDYWFRITVYDLDFELLQDDSVLAWDSGFFDFSDMMFEPSFWLDQNNGKYFLSVRFERFKDFWIDPILSPTRTLTNPIITESANQTDEFTTAYQPLFADDSLTDSSALDNTNNPYWSPQGSPIIEEFDFIDDHKVFETGYRFPFNSSQIIGGKAFVGLVDRGDGDMGNWSNIGEYFNESNYQGLSFNLTKEGVTGSDTSYNKIQLGQGQPFMSPYLNNTPFGSWYVRFKINRTGLDVDNSYLRIQPTEELNYTWQFNSETNDLGLTRAEILDNEWHEFTIMITDIGNFIEPYDTIMAYQVFFDEKLIVKANTTLGIVGIPRYSIEVVVNGSSTSISQSANCQFLVDYMGLILPLKTKLSDDSTMGDYSVESYSSLLNPVNNSLIGLWDFEKGEGSIAYDLTSNHDGVINGASWNTTTFDNDSSYSLDFESGESDYVEIIDNDVFTFNTAGQDDAYSISFWVNFEDVTTSASIISKYDYDTGGNCEWMLSLALGKLMWVMGDPDSEVIELRTVSGEVGLNLGQWYFISLNYNGNETFEGMSMYLNGSLLVGDEIINNSYGSYTGMSNTDTNITIGSATDGAGYCNAFDGLIDHVKIYDTNLTVSEIAYMYQNDPILLEERSSTISYRFGRDSVDDYYIDNDNIIGYWRLEAGEGLTTYDLSGNNHDGTISGADWSQITFDNGSSYSLDFEKDDADDNVIIVDHDDFSFTSAGQDQPFSVSAWVKLESDDITRIIICKGHDEQVTDDFEWSFGISNAQVRFMLHGSEGGTDYIMVRALVGVYADDEWHHVAVSYNGNETGQGVTLYLDNVSVNTIVNSYGSYSGMVNTDAELRMGNRYSLGGIGSEMDGLIDQVKIINYNLTAAEIVYMYQNDPYTRIGFSNTLDYASDYSTRYNTDNSSNYLEGEELLRLNFGNYYRRVDQYMSSKDSWYSYASEGINLINYPIMMFDMKATFFSDFGNNSQFNSSLSNAYITLYNESMYPIGFTSFYESWESESYTVGYTFEDLGFTVINDSWVSIRIDLRNYKLSDEIMQTWIDASDDEWFDEHEDLVPYVLRDLGGIGFSFYFNQINNSIGYSVKIDNLQFLPIQTLGIQDYPDLTEDWGTSETPLIYVDTGVYNNPIINTDIVKVGDYSFEFINKTGSPLGYGGEVIWVLQNGDLDNRWNINNGSLDYFIFWVYPIDCQLGFYTEGVDLQRDVEFWTGDTIEKPLYPYIFGDELVQYDEYNNVSVFMQPNQWNFFALPLKQFQAYSGGSPSDYFVKRVYWWFAADSPIHFILDGVSFVSGDWDYTNLTLNDYSANWDQSYQVNSTKSYQDLSMVNPEDREFTDQWTNNRPSNFNIDPVGTTGGQNEWVVDPDIRYITGDGEQAIDGVESTLGYSYDFDDNWKSESDSFRDDNLVAWYRMNEASGTDVNDSSLNDYDGENNGAAIVSNGVYGYALDFEDGDEDYVNISDHDDFTFSSGGGDDDPFSISAWINLETGSGYHVVTSKFKALGTTNEEYMISIYDSVVYFYLYDSDDDHIGVYGSTTLSIGSFNLITVTYSGSNLVSGLKIYVNGILETLTIDVSGTYNGMSNTAIPLLIGCSLGITDTTFEFPFDGIIDEVLIFDKELTASEVVAIHPDRYDGIVAKWKMDTGSGTDVYDSYGDHDGENDGGDWVSNGIYGYALDFESSESDYVNISDHDDFTFNIAGEDQPFSISVLINMETSAGCIIVTKYNLFDSDYEWELITAPSKFVFRTYTDENNYVGVMSDDTYSTDQWYHVVATYDGTEVNTGMNLYVNGISIDVSSSSLGSHTGMTNTEADVSIGSRAGVSDYADAKIDEVIIYDSELSASDVLSYYQEFEKASTFWFGSNVKAILTDSDTIYLDCINEGYLADLPNSTWFATNFNDKQIDWFYWNYIEIKITGYGDDLGSIVLRSGSSLSGDAIPTETMGFHNSHFTITTVALNDYRYQDFHFPFLLDNSTFNIAWHESSTTWGMDIEIDYIKLYHVEVNSLALSNYGGVSGQESLQELGYHYRSYNRYDLVSWDNNTKLFGENSFQLEVNKPISGSPPIYAYDLDTEITWDNTYISNVWEYDSNTYSGEPSEASYYDWSNYTAIEFYMRVNETVSGEGHATSGNMQLRIGCGYVDWGQRYYKNLTSWLVGGYTGSLVADTWYHFVIPFDDYNQTSGTWNQSLIDWFRLSIYNGEEGYNNGESPFTSADGNYTLWIDGLQPINHTFSVLGVSQVWDSNYVTTLINTFSGGSFNYDTITQSIMNHELKYVLNRNPTVSSFEGYITNGSNQVVYELNYTVLSKPSNNASMDYNHKFYIPKSYSFFNCTFGNGTVKTIESGFTITSYNDTHYVIVITVWESGDWEWNFITENACFYLETTPSLSDGLVYNTTSISYNLQLKNGSDYLIGYPVLIEVKAFDETVLASDIKTTALEGWVNSSIDDNFAMQSDKRLYLTATSTNESFLGYITTYSLNYQDFDAPTIEQMVFDEKLIEKYPFILTVTIDDDYTETEDISVIINYGFISSGSLPESAALTYQAGVFVVQISGQVAETTLYFNVVVEDNMSNSYTSSTFSSDWEESAPEGGDEGADGADGDTPPLPASTSSGSNLPIILVFLAGAGMVAILGYAVFRRVTVRTRRVETREVTTGIGGYGKTTERIEEKGG